MLRDDGHDVVPTEFGFRREQVIAEVLRDKAAGNINQAAQDQNPRKEEMKRPVPHRRADDKRNGKIDEGIHP